LLSNQQTFKTHFMKATIILSSALLFSIASLAQQVNASGTVNESAKATAGKSAAKANTNTAASLNAQSQMAGSMKEKAAESISQAKEKAVTAEEKSRAAAAATEGKTSQVAQAKNNSGTAAFVNASGNTSFSDNKTSQDASIKSSTAVSSKPIVKAEDHAAIAADKTNAAARTSINKTITGANKTSTHVEETIKPRPANIHMQGQVGANAGIRIK
jgi:hypothetical protein